MDGVIVAQLTDQNNYTLNKLERPSVHLPHLKSPSHDLIQYDQIMMHGNRGVVSEQSAR